MDRSSLLSIVDEEDEDDNGNATKDETGHQDGDQKFNSCEILPPSSISRDYA